MHKPLIYFIYDKTAEKIHIKANINQSDNGSLMSSFSQ